MSCVKPNQNPLACYVVWIGHFFLQQHQFSEIKWSYKGIRNANNSSISQMPFVFNFMHSTTPSRLSLPLDILHWFQPTLISLFSVFFLCSWIKKPEIGKTEEYINQETERAEFQQWQSKVSHYCGLHPDYSWWLNLIFSSGYKVSHGILLYPPMCLASFTAYM